MNNKLGIKKESNELINEIYYTKGKKGSIKNYFYKDIHNSFKRSSSVLDNILKENNKCNNLILSRNNGINNSCKSVFNNITNKYRQSYDNSNYYNQYKYYPKNNIYFNNNFDIKTARNEIKIKKINKKKINISEYCTKCKKNYKDWKIGELFLNLNLNK